MSSVLSCSELAVGYGTAPLLQGVQLDLQPGEVVALLGPNGGGKTTLLKTLAGLVPRVSGEILIGGSKLEELSVREVARRVGFVPQEEAWKFDFTVEEVVAMGRLPISNGFFDSEEDREAAVDAMKRAGCESLRDRSITRLSGGERQRVLIARALAQNTPILFLDEPTAHLDPQFQVGTASLLRTLANAGKSLLVAIHDLPNVSEMANRGILVYRGQTTTAQAIRGLLESRELDDAYSTPFERILSPTGRLLVVPQSVG